MKHPDATELEQRLSKACPTTKHAAIIMAERDEIGVERYKTTVDENPSTARQWAHHAAEEAADGLKYAIRAEEEARKMELEIWALRTANAALVEKVKRLETMNQELAEALERIEFCLPAGFDRVPSIESALGRAHAAIVKAKGQP